MDNDVHRFSHEAMASTFDVIVAGGEKDYAQQAAAAAFDVVDQVEKVLSTYVPSSDTTQINRALPNTWVRVNPFTLECLAAAAKITDQTSGAFDVTIGPLMAVWRNPDRSPRTPSAAELAEARARVGMNLVELDDSGKQVRVKKTGVRIDLGGIGKGYAVDRAVEVLKEWEIASALVNGGDSTTYAFGAYPGKNAWPVGVGGIGNESLPPFTLDLRDMTLSGSGTFRRGKHVMNPHTGKPVEGVLAAWSLHPSAAMADALSTAFMVMSLADVEAYCKKHDDTSAMLVLEEAGKRKHVRFGPWKGLNPA